jgi:putative component of membrane protein insertase Oxa1/YidC/SpoIIIJ protein YidD
MGYNEVFVLMYQAVIGFFATEYCAFTTNCAFYLLTLAAMWLGMYLIILLQVQVTCLMRETTFANVRPTVRKIVLLL